MLVACGGQVRTGGAGCVMVLLLTGRADIGDVIRAQIVDAAGGDHAQVHVAARPLKARMSSGATDT